MGSALDSVEMDIGDDGKDLSQKRNKDNAELKVKSPGSCGLARDNGDSLCRRVWMTMLL